ncbi:MAG: hypothetical protein WC601_07065 [Desulfotomaculaceae bacterium]
MPIKILILGEGANDVGIYDFNGQWISGSIINLLTKINDKVELSFIPINKKHLPNTLPMKDRPSLEGHGKVIQKMFFYSYIRKMEYDIMVYYGDTDKEAGTKTTKTQAKKASQVAYKQAYDAFDKFDVKGIAIIPLRMLESWLLADEQAFLNAFDIKVSLPKNPEMLWGDKRDPKSNHPKKTLERILSRFGLNSDTSNFCTIYDNASIPILESKCPISFPPFLMKAQEYLT